MTIRSANGRALRWKMEGSERASCSAIAKATPVDCWDAKKESASRHYAKWHPPPEPRSRAHIFGYVRQLTQAFNGQLGFVASAHVEPVQPFTTPGQIDREAAARDSGRICPLQSLEIAPQAMLINFPMQRASVLVDNRQSLLAEMKSPVMPRFDPEDLETPRAATFNARPDDTPNIISGMMLPPSETRDTSPASAELAPPVEIEEPSAQAISEDARVEMSSRTPTKSTYRPTSVRASLLAKKQDPEEPDDDDVWGDWVKKRDPTFSIYDAYFRPSMYSKQIRLDPVAQSAVFVPPTDTLEVPADSEASFDVSLESGSSMGSTRAIDNILPPMQNLEQNRLLHGDSMDSFSINTPSQHLSVSSGMSLQASEASIPVAGLENLQLAHTPEFHGRALSSPIDGPLRSDSETASIDIPGAGAPSSRLRSGEAPWASSASSSPLYARTDSPSRAALRTSPQRLAQRMAIQNDEFDARSLPTSKSTSSLFGSPRSKRSTELSGSPMSSEAQLFQRWTTLLTDRGSSQRTLKKARQLVELGVPTALRGRVWMLLAEKHMKNRPGVFEELVETSKESISNMDLYAFARLIQTDLDHCFPQNKPFHGLDGSSREDIRRILHAFAYHNPDVGYTEGMCLVVGLLLTHMRVEDTFWMLDALVSQYGMDRCYTGNMEQLHIDNLVVDELLRLADDAVHKKLQDMRIEPLMFLPGWLLPIFVRTLPWMTLLRVWDMFLSHGHTYLVRAAVSVICLSRGDILSPRMSPGRAETLRHLVFVASPPLMPDSVLNCARELPVSDKDIAKMLRNAAKLVRENGATTHPIDTGNEERPVALQGKPVSRGTLRLLTGRKKSGRS